MARGDIGAPSDAESKECRRPCRGGLCASPGPDAGPALRASAHRQGPSSRHPRAASHSVSRLHRPGLCPGRHLEPGLPWALGGGRTPPPPHRERTTNGASVHYHAGESALRLLGLYHLGLGRDQAPFQSDQSASQAGFPGLVLGPPQTVCVLGLPGCVSSPAQPVPRRGRQALWPSGLLLGMCRPPLHVPASR